MKVLINSCYGGFSFSEDFINHINSLTKNQLVNHYDLFARNNQFLVEEAIKFGLEKASGMCAKLSIVEIPDGLDYYINEYDGYEHIQYTFLTVHPDELVTGLSYERLKLAKQATFISMLNEADYWDGDESNKSVQ